jgi:hypothetical protein
MLQIAASLRQNKAGSVSLAFYYKKVSGHFPTQGLA